MKTGKNIGCAVLGALALAVIPFQCKKDEETGTLEVRSLLWGLRKTPGDGKDHYSFAIPASGLDEADEKEDAAPSEEAPAEEAPES